MITPPSLPCQIQLIRQGSDRGGQLETKLEGSRRFLNNRALPFWANPLTLPVPAGPGVFVGHLGASKG